MSRDRGRAKDVSTLAYEMAMREIKAMNDAATAVYGKPKRRSPQFSDIRQRYDRACWSLQERGVRQTKQAIATEMGIDRKTLNSYIDRFGLPYPPQ